jgi:hypothetical protein
MREPSSSRLFHSLLGGVGIVLTIIGLFAVAIGAGGNSPPAFLVPVGLIVLVLGMAMAVINIPKARSLARDGRAQACPTAQPSPPLKLVVTTVHCYLCGEVLVGVCRFCGKSFCSRHGWRSEMLCRKHALVVLLAWTVLIGGGILVWRLFFHQ